MRYWIDTISEDLEKEVRNFLFHYINEYEYTDVQNFFKHFNKNIMPSTDLETTRLLESP